MSSTKSLPASTEAITRGAEDLTVEDDLRIHYPVEEELLAAVEHVLEWFEQWDRHADHSNDFGGEQDCIRRLRFALREVYLRDEL
jgi:hypothetical protein